MFKGLTIYMYILSTARTYLCVFDEKYFLNDPHSDHRANMSNVLIPQNRYTVWLYMPEI